MLEFIGESYRFRQCLRQEEQQRIEEKIATGSELIFLYLRREENTHVVSVSPQNICLALHLPVFSLPCPKQNELGSITPPSRSPSRYNALERLLVGLSHRRLCREYELESLRTAWRGQRLLRVKVTGDSQAPLILLWTDQTSTFNWGVAIPDSCDIGAVF